MSESTPVNYKREVTGIVFFAFAIIFGLAYYLPHSATGVLGDYLRGFGMGLIGSAAYAVPVLLIYASIDYFLEKRAGVAPIRVRSVLILLLCLSSIFAVWTLDIEFLRTLSIDATKNDSLASKALSILFQSGVTPSMLKSDPQSLVLPGGLIGGSIALGLMLLAAKPGALIILLAFTLSQLVLIFNVSLKKSAFKTAEVIRQNTRRVSEAIRQSKAQQASDSMVYSVPAEPQRESALPVFDVPVSPFEELDHRTSHGFVDLNAMDAGSRSQGVDKALSFDVDTAVLEDTSFENSEYPRVKTDFIGGPTEPLPTAHPISDADWPDFLRPEKEPTFIDLPIEAPVVEGLYNTQHIHRIGVDGRPISEGPEDSMEPDIRSPFVEFNSKKVTSQRSNTSSDNPVQPSPRPQPVRHQKPREFKAAPTSLLKSDNNTESVRSNKNALALQGQKLVDTLASFGVDAKVVNVTHGPAITRFELSPGPGIKVSRIVNLTDDLALAMAAVGVRIEAPIPGKSAIGIEIPNKETSPVTLRSLIESTAFRKQTSPLTVALGRDIPGNPIFCDLATMPHLLIAGATGSGKSVCINAILISILCKASPEQVKLIMIDPKVVELSIYNGIPHLLAPVVTDPKKAANTLNWAVGEMTRRYALFAETSVRDYKGYNEYLKLNGEEPIPLILIVIDELADLMQVASKEVEESIARLTAMARAAGIHLLIATQRPSVDVITGVIKANIPSRIAFAVSSQVDSRTILDMGGAEKLLGKGDMLYYPQSMAKPQRGQGAFVSDREVESIIEFLKSQNYSTYDPEVADQIVSASAHQSSSQHKNDGEEDELLPQAVDIVLNAGCASVSILQRKMNIGYPRAARLVDRMEDKGYIGPFEGSKPRRLIITQTQWLEIQSKGDS